MISCMEIVLQNFSRTLVRNRNICKEDPCGIEKESFIFGQNVTNELAFDFETFFVCKKLLFFFNAKFWLIFGSLLLFIFFFNCL